MDSKALVVPSFTGLGAPHWDPRARGAIFGLSRDSGIPELTAATLESIAFQTKSLILSMIKDGANFKELRVDGGMAKNSWFVQNLANTLDLTVLRPKEVEATALGVAFLAGINCGLLPDIESLNSIRFSQKTFKPKRDKVDTQNKKFSTWLKAVERTKGLF
mgnify:FL=1